MEYPTLTPEQVYADFSERLKRFITFTAGAGKEAPNAGKATLIATLREKAAEDSKISAFAIGYALLATLRSIVGEGASGAEAATLAVHWSLDRKLKEAYGAFGISDYEAYWVTEIAKAVLTRTSPEDISVYENGLIAETVILENYQADDFRQLLQVNRFNDTTWFNKEAFERVLFYVPLFLLTENASAFTEAACEGTEPARKVKLASQKKEGVLLHETIEKVAESFYKAELASGYRFDTLIEVLSETVSATK
jgi:hypothetical protein